MKLFDDEVGWLFHGTSPSGANDIRKRGFDTFRIFFATDFVTALEYSTTTPSRGRDSMRFDRLREFVTEHGPDAAPTAIIRIREDNPVLVKCRKYDVKIPPSFAFECQDVDAWRHEYKEIKFPTAEVCIIPPMMKRKQGLTGFTRTWESCKWKPMRWK